MCRSHKAVGRSWSSSQTLGMLKNRMLLALVVCVSSLFVPQAESAVCAAGVTKLEVSSSSDVQHLQTALNCTGGGLFDVAWYGTVAVNDTFVVSEGSDLNVTGFPSSSTLAEDSTPTATIDGGHRTSSRFFLLGNNSVLSLHNLVLDGGYSTLCGGAVYTGYENGLPAITTINIVDCTLRNNTAEFGGGICCTSCEINISGNTTFVENAAMVSSGAVNGGGGAIYATESVINIGGNTTFQNSYSGENGGAIYSYNSEIHISGKTNFDDNVAAGSGGAIYLSGYLPSVLTVGGESVFDGNTAGIGGAIAVRNTELYLIGSDFYNNSANIWGGAISLVGSNFSFPGNPAFTGNSARSSGGAIYSRADYNSAESSLSFPGNPAFIGNSAGFDGGVIYSSESSLSFPGNPAFMGNSAGLHGGAIFSTDDVLVSVNGTASFDGNIAEQDDGGAMAILQPYEFAIVGASFTSNRATRGGAVRVASSTVQGKIFRGLTFEGNFASMDGGALYTDAGAGQDLLDNCTFLHNVAGSTGGALLVSGGYEFGGFSSFIANEAGFGGLAIESFGELGSISSTIGVVIEFANNSFHCPSGQYSFDADLQLGGNRDARFELVCSRCSDSIAFWVRVDTGTHPVCADLPKGVKAVSSGTTLSTLDLEEGYYRVSAESHVVTKCLKEDACSGGSVAGEYCARGYEGPLCAVCAAGFAPGAAFSCHRCSGNAKKSATGTGAALLVVVLSTLVLIVVDLTRVVEQGNDDRRAVGVLGSWERKFQYSRALVAKIIPLTALKVVVVVWQIITQFSGIAADAYPDVYEEFLRKLDFINVDLGFSVSAACLLAPNFFGRLVFSTISPIFVLLVLRGCYAVAKRRNRGSEEGLRVVKNKHLSAALFVVFLVYSSASFTVFQTFVCDTLDNGTSFLRADYNLTCSGALYSSFTAYAVVMVCVYPIGIPLFVAWWLYKHQKELQEPDRETTAHLEPFSDVWAAYKPSRFFFEVVEFARRLTLTGIAAFVLPGSAAQIAIVLLLAVVFMFISESLSPFNNKIDMWLYRWGNGIVLGTMYIALLVKVDVSKEDAETLSAFAAVLIAGNVFMAIAVVVQAALMLRGWFETRKPSASPEPRHVISACDSGASNIGGRASASD